MEENIFYLTYVTTWKHTKVRTLRLYLQSKKIDGSDDDLLSSAFDVNHEGSVTDPLVVRQSLVTHNKESSLINSTLDMQSLVSQNQESSLIGSTLERESLVSEQDKEYQESLIADERKKKREFRMLEQIEWFPSLMMCL